MSKTIGMLYYMRNRWMYSLGCDTTPLPSSSTSTSTILPILFRSDTSNYESTLHVSTISDEEALSLFRFTIPQVQQIIQCMNLPPTITTDNQMIIDTVDAMCLLLRRLTYPSRYIDLEFAFNIHETVISRIVSTMTDILIHKYDDFIELWPGLTRARVAVYSAIVTNRFPVISNIWGFIDGTMRYICRPSRRQRDYYSYKKQHAQKFQCITAPDGLIISCCGPYLGKSHDLRMLSESGIQERLLPFTRQETIQYNILGDKAYRFQSQIMTPVTLPTEQETEYNRVISSVRIAVEWGFGKVSRYFAFTTYKHDLKINLQPIAEYYKLAVLFTNCHTCFNGSQASQYFNCGTPTINEYLNV